MARNSGGAHGAHASEDTVDLGKLVRDAIKDESRGDEVILTATDETIALLNSAFASDVAGVDSFAGWNFLSFA